ncbi:helix-turn-helix domain-containing protein [Streptomyces europaeiscabiei]|uniref:helix-turn-helix domain-containing protein n=1 Tax=Streptomyces europaeiscabiei TaxID=146819 RepID=UPI0029B5BF95|nr:helix-turn-helix transcriptional regulator [Streptomyces europaeiscabiei]MDX3611305.1 helix-turn-helix transcriptional regulator [Streptomyces europaeiscabiei]
MTGDVRNGAPVGAESAERFGPALRRRRMAVGLSLAELAERVFYSKGYLSRVETGARPPNTVLARRCDAALNAGGILASLVPADDRDEAADGPMPVGGDGGTERKSQESEFGELGADEMWTMGMGQDGSIWFQPADRRQVVAMGAASLLAAGLGGPAGADPGADAEETVHGFSALFPLIRALGQRASPATVLPTVVAQTRTLESVAAHASGRGRVESYLLASRYAEYAGWMAQEAGRDDMAVWWTNRAVALARRGGDRELAAYALVRFALIRMYAGDALSTVALALQAQHSADAGPRVRGLAALREAQGHALAGAQSECRRALDRARDLLAEAPRGGAPVLGTTGGGDPVALATAGCLHDLGRPGQASELLGRELSAIPLRSRRLRVRWAARQALAQASAGELDQACEVLRDLLPEFSATASWTVRTDLVALAKLLAQHQTHRGVREMFPLLTEKLYMPPAHSTGRR